MAVETQNRMLVSQILPEAPCFHGPLAYEVAASRARTIDLELLAAKPTIDALGSTHVEPPVALWSSEASGSWGPLSVMSFISLWVQEVGMVAGVRVSLRIDDPASMSEHPFVAMHPSGFLQAISFNAETGGFQRQILYPLGTGTDG